MAETTADVRRDIEMTRERMSTTLAQLEQKLNVTQLIRDHPWPALAVALGAGVALSGTKADVKAAAATVAATEGASGKVGVLLDQTGQKVGSVLDEAVARLLNGVNEAIQSRLDLWIDELKVAIGAPTDSRPAARPSRSYAGATGESMGAQGTFAPSRAD